MKNMTKNSANILNTSHRIGLKSSTNLGTTTTLTTPGPDPAFAAFREIQLETALTMRTFF